jgi:hypothetical protein
MAVLKKRYKDLNDTMRHIRLQVEESLPFAAEYVPNLPDPVALFHWLKPKLKYRKDPPGVELLQSFPTLMRNNYYGVPGTGDCDCFSIAVLAACAVQPWTGARQWVKLAGRNKREAVHIWTGITWKGKDYALDMTNQLPLQEREYQYVQKFYVK